MRAQCLSELPELSIIVRSMKPGFRVVVTESEPSETQLKPNQPENHHESRRLDSAGGNACVRGVLRTVAPAP